MKHIGFHEYVDGVRFNPDCPTCQESGGDYSFALEALADDCIKKKQEFEDALNIIIIFYMKHMLHYL